MTYQDFSEIAPFDNDDIHDHIVRLVAEPGFEHAVKWVLPDVEYSAFAQQLMSLKTQEEFQLNIMVPFLKVLEAKTSNGVSCSGIDNYLQGNVYTLISNHRDIVLDASFLNLCLVREGRPTCEVAIGNNLLIYPWISDLVRLNKSFIVKRDTGMRGALDAAKQLSGYIHHAISSKHQSLWIAHREGRAKDSNDRTQESLIKMLGLAGEGSFVEHVREINLMPVSISYEFDPNDYLKVREFLMKKRNPEYKKSQHDDLLSMETGLLQQKGRIHFALTECLSDKIAALPADIDRNTAVAEVCRMVDHAIHTHYRLYPINYIAYDQLNGTETFAGKEYTTSDLHQINEYFNKQLAKVDVPDLTADDETFMRRMMLTMYANPLINKLNAK
jgi:hypothetical protein